MIVVMVPRAVYRCRVRTKTNILGKITLGPLKRHLHSLMEAI
jgi:hypothetical protein